jgi:hypothetical protein
MTNDVASPAKTLLPSRELYRKAVRRDLLISVPVFLVIIVSQILLQLGRARIADDGTGYALVWVYVGLALLAPVLTVALYKGMLGNSRIDLGATNFTVTNWMGRKRTIEHADVGTVIQAMLRQPAVTVPALFVLDRAGKRVLTMYGSLWPTEAMLAVGAAAPVEPTVFPAPVSFAELRSQYPNGVSWARAHPILLAVLVAGGVFLGLIVFLIVLFSTLFGSI